MTLDQISSAIYNHVYSGLAGITSNPKISLDQLKDEVIAEKNQIIKEYLLKGVIRLEELFLSINCIEVGCDSKIQCPCIGLEGETALHFEIPPIMHLNGLNTIKFVGSVDKNIPYKIYTDDSYRYHKYKKHSANKPYVYIDTAVNANGNMDGWIFNVPFVKFISVTALFQDPRRLLEWDCCHDNSDTYLDMGILSDEIIRRLTTKYITWYKQAASPVTPNTQQPK